MFLFRGKDYGEISKEFEIKLFFLDNISIIGLIAKDFVCCYRRLKILADNYRSDFANIIHEQAFSMFI